ncbi:sugar ABC transporter ATP-binding protein [Amycolatopsis pithecellobii]|uniref:ATP-binding cassette domain-containing protein n=1 Tax=Amycolatopsis pithecellobii TaxID=664692 RepID=A0A6N7YKR9_9PSEU|nr:sugar ABC transporter ATP-binding protein [Amycolatopsis pithecellobii]MTD52612.1 ATP-binding cassette domain-containing protein [Amycolatopsis pithecellobii]
MYTVKDLHKTYGGVTALAGVDFEILPGEVHALLGANGAGKSTLIKILVGAAQPDAGRLELDGAPVSFTNTRDAADRGVAIVSQELTLFPHLDVLQNLFLGREPLAAGIALDRRAMRRIAAPVLAAIGLDVDVSRPLGSLRLGEQQLVEIARALLEDPKILILDEPTSALQATETERLLGVVRNLRDRGVAVVYVSHFLEDVFAVADRITVLRSGKVAVSRRPRAEMTIQGTVRAMLGEAVAHDRRTSETVAFDDASGSAGSLVLTGVAVTGILEPFDLTARPGEVVGLAGLEGSGARAVLDVVFGRLRPSRGRITLPEGGGWPMTMNRAVKAGIAYIPADRKRLGLMLDVSIAENISTVKGGPLKRMGMVLGRRTMQRRAEHWRETLNIAMSSSAQPVGSLSGGNQQKVVFAKWLEADPSVILLDDPSRGVDVGAKDDMHAIIAQMAAGQKVVLYTSSDLEEMAKICDRVVVFFGGRAVGEVGGEQLSESVLMEAINVGGVDEGRTERLRQL